MWRRGASAKAHTESAGALLTVSVYLFLLPADRCDPIELFRL
jgi:hypothetical protein